MLQVFQFYHSFHELSLQFGSLLSEDQQSDDVIFQSRPKTNHKAVNSCYIDFWLAKNIDKLTNVFEKTIPFHRFEFEGQ